MALPNAITPINEWACGIACLSWHLHRIPHLPASQDQIIIRCFGHFPKWCGYKGITETGDLITLQELLFVPFKRILFSRDQAEILDFLSKYQKDYLMGFIFGRKGSNHCMALGEWTANDVTYMDAVRPNSSILTEKWTDLFQKFDPEFLVTFR
jgi:hypothetical protein